MSDNIIRIEKSCFENSWIVIDEEKRKTWRLASFWEAWNFADTLSKWRAKDTHEIQNKRSTLGNNSLSSMN